jgi:hypothetical protein
VLFKGKMRSAGIKSKYYSLIYHFRAHTISWLAAVKKGTVSLIGARRMGNQVFFAIPTVWN